MPEKPTSRVSDLAQLLSNAQFEKISKRLQTYEYNTGHQAAVALFESIDGRDIEGLSNELFRKWLLGSKEKNDGILLVLALQERKLRIEVGYGLEARLTDAWSSKLIRDRIVPAMKEHDIALALNEFVDALEMNAKGENITPPDLPDYRMPGMGIILLVFIAVTFFAIMFLASMEDRSRRTFGSRGRRYHGNDDNWNNWGSGGGFGGGGFGGGSSGGGGWPSGGGFSGGGGGLSGGGGASGGW